MIIIKRNTKQLFFIVPFMLIALLVFMFRLDSFATSDLPTTAGSTLTTGTYTVSSDITITATSVGQSGLVIPSGNNVTIEIPEGKILTVKGADAQGQTGAGAGIYVPEGATLTITGYGTLNATGGNAANGGNGGNGGNGRQGNITDSAYSGNGGSGGYGGGGAGAGIGGKGGNGGDGGNGGSTRYVDDSSGPYQENGSDGSNGSNGLNGYSMGIVKIYSSITTNISAGTCEGKQGNTGNQGNMYFNRGGGGDGHFGAGGGAGAGGNSGGPAQDIGGGGYGGGGAPGGGSGACGCNWLHPMDSLNDGYGEGYSSNSSKTGGTSVTWNGSSVSGGSAGTSWGSNGTAGLNGTYEILHVHVWNYGIKNDMIYAYCSETKPDSCEYSNKENSLCYVRVIAGNERYTDKTYSNYSVSKSQSWIDLDLPNPVVNFYIADDNGNPTGKTTTQNSGAASEGGTPKNIGKYILEVSVNNAKITRVFSITDLVSQEVTSPPVPDLTYNGKPQDLISGMPKISKGNTSSSIYYSLDGNNWSTIKPSATNPGKYNVYYKIDANDVYMEYVNFVTSEIKPKNITSDMVIEIKNKNYTGAPIEPEVKLYDGELLTQGENADYVVNYENNVDVGTASIIIAGRNNYQGQIIKNFEITTNQMADNMISDIPNYVYTGEEIKPKITVTDGSKELIEGTYYTKPVYNNNKNAGTASVTITGIGNYSGSTTKNFEITRRPLADSMISSVSNYVYTGEEIKPEIKVTDREKELVENTDYKLTYKNNKNAGTASIEIEGINNYSAKITKEFEIMKKPLTDNMVSDIPKKQIYTGEDIKPEITVTDGNLGLVKGMDYEVSYINNKDAGQASIEIKGIGNYKEAVTKTFEIVPKLLVDSMVSDISEQQLYTSKEIKPRIVVNYEGELLTEGKDYKLTYENNINVGTASVTVTGLGAYVYSNEITKNFEIIPVNLNSDIIVIYDIHEQVYTGSSIEPPVAIKYGEILLNKDVDYTLQYENNVNIGTSTITVGGIGNYTGEVTKNFEITPRLLSNMMVSDIPDQKYTGMEVKPSVEMQDDGKLLKEGLNYTVQYENNTNIGVGTAKITGIGNYTGEITKDFIITDVTLTDLSASKIVKGQTLGDSKVTGKALDAQGNEIEGTFAFVDETFVPAATSDQNPSKYKITFTPKLGHGNYVLHDSVPIFVDDWGDIKKANGKVYWEDNAGLTSAIVSEGTTWLKEELNGKYWWFGLENPKKDDSTQVFEVGSRFWVMCLNKNSSDWNIYYNKLDNKYKNNIKDGRINLFVIGVTSPDGTDYTNFESDVPVYIQLDQNWDQDLQFVFVDNSTDEEISDLSIISSKEVLGCPVREDNIMFVKTILKHFSAYAVFDKKDEDDSSSSTSTISLDSTNNDNSNGVTNEESSDEQSDGYRNITNSSPPNSNALLQDMDTGNISPIKALITLVFALANKIYKRR